MFLYRTCQETPEDHDAYSEAFKNPASQGLAEFARSHLQSREIQVRLQSSVAELLDDFVVLSSGESLPSKTLIWCAGIAPNPLVAGLGLAPNCTENGFGLSGLSKRRFRIRIWRESC